MGKGYEGTRAQVPAIGSHREDDIHKVSPIPGPAAVGEDDLVLVYHLDIVEEPRRMTFDGHLGTDQLAVTS